APTTRTAAAWSPGAWASGVAGSLRGRRRHVRAGPARARHASRLHGVRRHGPALVLGVHPVDEARLDHQPGQVGVAAFEAADLGLDALERRPGLEGQQVHAHRAVELAALQVVGLFGREPLAGLVEVRYPRRVDQVGRYRLLGDE